MILGWIFFCGFMVVELGVAMVVMEGGGVFIMSHMWVHGGEGGGLWWPWVSGVAMGWWRGHGFWFGYVLRGGGGSGGGNKWLR